MSDEKTPPRKPVRIADPHKPENRNTANLGDSMPVINKK